MSIPLQAANGAIGTLSLAFNNDGPLGSLFRPVGERREPAASGARVLPRYDALHQRERQPP